MHQRKSKKIILYFFLLISVGTLQNFEINNYKFYKIQKIKVTGLEHSENQSLINDLTNLNLKNIFNINKTKIINIFEKNSLIEEYQAKKKYPFTIDIKVLKTNFLAKMYINEKIYLIGSNGKLIKNNSNKKKLPLIFGSPNINEFLEFKKIIDQSLIPFESVNELFFFPSKRWDIELNNNIRIKLPKDDIETMLNNVYEIMNDNDFSNIKIIDARVKNQIILND